MMKTRNRFYILANLLVSVLLLGCNDEQEMVALPIVETVEISKVTTTTASSGGTVSDDGGALIVDKGICWDIHPQPTVALSTKNSLGPNKGSFVSELSDLIPDHQYFVRAYATNSVGTSYGNEFNFFTDKNSDIIYKIDGRTVSLGDPSPLAVDLSQDGQVDFTVFVELTANSQGDHLYAGVNPIGPNQIKSGPPIDANFLNMGFLVAETAGSPIDGTLDDKQRWTSDYGILVIRNTSTNGKISYEGHWENSSQIAGIQYNINGSVYYGWLRIEFDETTEVVTLIDYAYNSVANQSVPAGATAIDLE